MPWHAEAALGPGFKADGDGRWRPAPPSLTLSYDLVDVWRVSLEMPERETRRLAEGLSVAEWERASRFQSTVDCARFVAAHGVLRSILGKCLGMDPGSLHFSNGRFRKPALAGPSQASGVEFNLSHSGGLALVAASLDRRLGVDLERIDSGRSGQEIAERFFSSREIAALRALPRSQQTDAFFACWTRKEAYLKARGDGLSLRLDEFSVSVLPEESPALLGSTIDPEPRRWTLRDLDVGPGWAAALAAEGTNWSCRCWEWRPRED